MIVSTVCVMLALIAAEPMAPTARTRYPYWQMVNDVVTQIESQPARPISINDGLRTPGQEYPFESFRHLRTSDLLRAAREGATVARQQEGLGKSPVEVDQLVLKNILIALEYLPLIIKENPDSPPQSSAKMHFTDSPPSKGDLDDLFIIIKNRDDDPVLRCFLLERTVAGFAPPSLFSISLPLYIRSRDQEFRDILSFVASHPGEDPVVQVLAIDVFMKYILDQYETAFKNDPKVKTMLEAGQPLTYTAAVDVDSLGLSSETFAELRRLGVRMSLFAEAIAGHIGEGSVRDEKVKARTKEALEFMRDNLAGVDKAVLAEYLAGNAPEPKGMFPSFPVPTEPTLEPPPQDTLVPVELPADGGPPKF